MILCNSINSWIQRFLTALLLSMLLASCATGPRTSGYERYVPLIYAEVYSQDRSSDKAIPAVLPVSESIIQIKPVPSLTENEIESVQIAESQYGPYLQFYLTPLGTMNLMQITDEYRGRRLVLTLGGEPAGAWRVNRILANGILGMYLEPTGEPVPAIAEKINQAIHSKR